MNYSATCTYHKKTRGYFYPFIYLGRDLLKKVFHPIARSVAYLWKRDEPNNIHREISRLDATSTQSPTKHTKLLPVSPRYSRKIKKINAKYVSTTTYCTIKTLLYPSKNFPNFYHISWKFLELFRKWNI